ncbi:type II secretion system secretin GspD [Novosphingopyxis iocasae]|uniref:type II secretion system secretin GspD n=1 Tax=Novosphingopyxis iocasae TaxID=2762729 RepID=UPI0031B5E3A8
MLRKFSLIAAAFMMVVAEPVSAQYVMNVRDADIRAFVQEAARVTGRTFIVDSKVQGTVSVVTERPLSRSEYFEIFLSTLRANGLVAVPTSGGAYRIQQSEGAATQPSRVGSRARSASEFVTEVFRLRSIDAAQAVETLRPLVSREGSITANRSANSLIVADYADNVRRMRELIGRIDRDNSATRVVNLQNADANEIAQSLQALATQGVSGEGAVAPVSVVPFPTSNSIALRGDPTAVAEFVRIARDLDQRSRSNSEVKIYRLDYADAETLLPVLQQLVGQQQSATVTAPSADIPALARNVTEGSPTASSGRAAAVSTVTTSSGASGNGVAGRRPAIVTRYEGTNAIIVAADPDTQRTLGEVIRQLDVRQDQIQVEAIIVEISDSLAKELGVQFLFGDNNVGYGVTNFSNINPNILDIAGGVLANQLDQQTTVINGDVVTTSNGSATGNLLRQNAAQAVLGARGGFLGLGIPLGGGGILGALINAVRADTESNVLSTPSLTVNDGLEGSILFGQEIPVSTGEALSNNFDNAFRTIQRQNVGIELIVTPQVNAGDEVRLDLKQEVSSIAGPVSDNFNELIINKREIKTTLTVGNGEIAVLGGLLDDNERRTIEKIPFLGDIPIIGELFKSRGRTRVKTNLLVFIRPTILRSRADQAKIAAQRYGYLRAQQLLRRPDEEPSLDQLVRDYLNTVPPGGPYLYQQGDQLYGAAGPLPPPPVGTVVVPVEVPASTAPGSELPAVETYTAEPGQ